MYDKVKLFLPSANSTPNVAPYLTNPKEKTDLCTGEVMGYSGSVDGLLVWQNQRGIGIEGSLAKYHFGNNICTLNIHDTALALQKLSDTLHTDLSQAKVNSLEFGTNFLMKQPPSEYLKLLGNLSRLSRVQATDNTLYYSLKGSQPSKILCFYNKAAEAHAKGVVFPKGITPDSYLLRYEIRLRRLPHKLLHLQQLTADKLAQREVFLQIAKFWEKHYFDIQKHQQIKIDGMQTIKTPKQAKDMLLSLLVSHYPDEVNTFFENLKQNKTFTDKNDYSRFKRMINTPTKATYITTNEAIEELNDEVRNAVAYL